MARIVIRPRAFADLVEIWSYIAADSPVAADSLLFSIDRKVRALGHQPGIGRERPELGAKVRSFSYKKYVI
jgi:toxin ParE1/3/4